jgi:hypothetical protein
MVTPLVDAALRLMELRQQSLAGTGQHIQNVEVLESSQESA